MSIAQTFQNGINGSMGKAYEMIDKAPTTNMRILLTLVLTLGTAIKYWSSSMWIPDMSWLVFLAGMAGLDVWQHYNKRKTSWHPSTLNINNQESEELETSAGDTDAVAGREEIG